MRRQEASNAHLLTIFFFYDWWFPLSKTFNLFKVIIFLNVNCLLKLWTIYIFLSLSGGRTSWNKKLLIQRRKISGQRSTLLLPTVSSPGWFSRNCIIYYMNHVCSLLDSSYYVTIPYLAVFSDHKINWWKIVALNYLFKWILVVAGIQIYMIITSP